MGFIKNVGSDGVPCKVSNDYVMSGEYEVDIAGIRWVVSSSCAIPKFLMTLFDFDSLRVDSSFIILCNLLIWNM